MTENDGCHNCFYFDPVGQPPAREGECRRHAPSILMLPAQGDERAHTITAWPVIFTEDWCGEWQPAKRPKI